MALRNAHYSESVPDWIAYQNDPSNDVEAESDDVEKIKASFDPVATRIGFEEQSKQWAAKFPVTEFGYTAYHENMKTRDDHSIDVKIYRPSKFATSSAKLPLLFAIHGGGWTIGNHHAEEMFLLRPIMQNFDFCMISVNYRLAPERPFPTPLNDCWDALTWAVDQAERLSVIAERVFLAGSSSGANLAAAISLMARDAGSPKISGLVLNVPTVCHPQRFPKDLYELDSYQQMKGSGVSLSLLWDCYIPNLSEGSNPLVSPLLGNLKGFSPHVIFVAGQDCLRDEGIAYAEALNKAPVSARLWVYPGLPHEFIKMDGLQSRERWCTDVVEGVRSLLSPDDCATQSYQTDWIHVSLRFL